MKKESKELDPKYEYDGCKDEAGELCPMFYIGEVHVWQLWQCPICKIIKITNYV